MFGSASLVRIVPLSLLLGVAVHIGTSCFLETSPGSSIATLLLAIGCGQQLQFVVVDDDGFL